MTEAMIRALAEAYPNDASLGAQVRKLILDMDSDNNIIKQI